MSALHVCYPSLRCLLWDSKVTTLPVQITHVTTLEFSVALCVRSLLHGIIAHRTEEGNDYLVIVQRINNNNLSAMENFDLLVVVG